MALSSNELFFLEYLKYFVDMLCRASQSGAQGRQISPFFNLLWWNPDSLVGRDVVKLPEAGTVFLWFVTVSSGCGTVREVGKCCQKNERLILLRSFHQWWFGYTAGIWTSWYAAIEEI